MAIIDLVKWDTRNPKLLAWKFPSQELSTWTQLIVNESQEALLVTGGVYEGPFKGGRHTLETQNIPLVRNLLGIPFGGKSPFTAEVWYVNKSSVLDLKWGTIDPIQLKDPLYDIMIPVRAFGQFGIRISNSKKFLIKLVGTLSAFDAETVNSYFRGMFSSKTKSLISDIIIRKKTSVLDISMYLDEISNSLKCMFEEVLDDYGIDVIRFDITSINVPEEDQSVIDLKAALSKKAEVGILGQNYQQVRSFDVLESAVQNESNVGALMGIGIGSGLGGAFAPNIGSQAQRTGSVLDINSPATQENNHSTLTKIELIRQLGSLKEQGLLSEDEFNAEKKKILG